MMLFQHLFEDENAQASIENLLQQPNTTAQQLLEDDNFMSMFMTSFHPLVEHLLKPKVANEIIELILKSIQSIEIDESLSLDNQALHESKFKLLNVISEIFHQNNSFCDAVLSNKDNIDILFNCLHEDLNPLIGGLIAKIITALFQSNSNVFNEVISNSLCVDSGIFDALIQNLNSLFAADFIYQLATSHTPQATVDMLSKTRLIEKLLMVISSSDKVSSKIKKENAFHALKNLFTNSIGIVQESNLLFLHLFNDYSLSFMGTILRCSNVYSRSLIFKLLSSVLRDTDNSISDDTTKLDVIHDACYDYFMNDNSALKSCRIHAAEQITKFLFVYLEEILEQGPALDSPDVELSYGLTVLTLISNVSALCPDKILSHPTLIKSLSKMFFAFYEKSVICVQCRKALISISSFLSSDDEFSAKCLYDILKDEKFFEQTVTKWKSIEDLNSKSVSLIDLASVCEAIFEIKEIDFDTKEEFPDEHSFLSSKYPQTMERIKVIKDDFKISGIGNTPNNSFSVYLNNFGGENDQMDDDDVACEDDENPELNFLNLVGNNIQFGEDEMAKAWQEHDKGSFGDDQPGSAFSSTDSYESLEVQDDSKDETESGFAQENDTTEQNKKDEETKVEQEEGNCAAYEKNVEQVQNSEAVPIEKDQFNEGMTTIRFKKDQPQTE